MKTVALGELFADKVPSLDPRTYPNEEFELWSIPAFDAGQPDIARGSEIGSTKKCVEPHDVLLSRIVPHIRRSWIVSPLNGRRKIASGEWIVFRDKRFAPEYLRQFLTSDPFHSQFMLTVAGVGGSLLRARPDGVAKIEIPLPPLDEQRRIAAILDQADALRHKRKEAMEDLGKLAQAIFNSMFGDPVRNPRQWPVKSLTEICHCYSGGTPSKSNDVYWIGTLPWFSAKDLKEDDLFDSIDHINPEVTDTSSLKLLSSNTVAIVVRGMILAHTFPVCVLRIPATINQDLKALLPRQPIETQFLASTLRAQAACVLQQVSEAGHGTKRLDAEALGKIQIILPPIEMQRYFARQVLSIQEQLDQFRNSASNLDALFASLQHRAFRGEL